MGNEASKTGDAGGLLPSHVARADHSSGLRSIAPITTGAALASSVMRKMWATEPMVSPAGMAMLPPLWAEVVRLSASTSRPSMFMTLLKELHAKQGDACAVRRAKGDSESGAAAADDVKVIDDTTFVQQISTGAELQEMAAAKLDGVWLDQVQRRRWGMPSLNPGAVIFYDGAFGVSSAAHFGVYLGFFSKGDELSFAMQETLKGTIASLKSGDARQCIARFRKAFLADNAVRKLRGGGGERVVDGVDLVLELAVNNVYELRAHVMSMQAFCANGAMLKASGLYHEVNAMSDTVSLVGESDVPLWLLRALCCIGTVEYNVLSCNCEHMSSYITTGRAMSSQVEELFGPDSPSWGEVARVVGRKALLPLLTRSKGLARKVKAARPKMAVDTPLGSALALRDDPLDAMEAGSGGGGAGSAGSA